MHSMAPAHLTLVVADKKQKELAQRADALLEWIAAQPHEFTEVEIAETFQANNIPYLFPAPDYYCMVADGFYPKAPRRKMLEYLNGFVIPASLKETLEEALIVERPTRRSARVQDFKKGFAVWEWYDENNPSGEYDKENEFERRFPIEDIFYDNEIKLDPHQLNSTRKQPGFKSPFTCEELDTILSGLHLPDIETWFEQLDWSPHKRDGWEPENYSGSDC